MTDDRRERAEALADVVRELGMMDTRFVLSFAKSFQRELVDGRVREDKPQLRLAQ